MHPHPRNCSPMKISMNFGKLLQYSKAPTMAKMFWFPHHQLRPSELKV